MKKISLDEFLTGWISVMQKVVNKEASFDITAYQNISCGFKLPKYTFSDLHTCGTAACGVGDGGVRIFGSVNLLEK